MSSFLLTAPIQHLLPLLIPILMVFQGEQQILRLVRFVHCLAATQQPIGGALPRALRFNLVDFLAVDDVIELQHRLVEL